MECNHMFETKGKVKINGNWCWKLVCKYCGQVEYESVK